MNNYLRSSQRIRQWFSYYLLAECPNIISQYLLECPSSDVRMIMSKLLSSLVHYCYSDPPLQVQVQTTTITTISSNNNNNSTPQASPKHTYRYINISDAIIQSVLQLLKRDVNDQGKHLIQYFQFFNLYAAYGVNECIHLIKLDIPLLFIQFALDDSSTSSSTSITRHQYCDLTKLFCIVSTLLRCYDVSVNCTPCSSSSSNQNLLQNPYSHFYEIRENQTESITFSSKLNEYVNTRATYIKKLLEEAPNLDETIKLMKFLCWENGNFSMILLSELLWMVSFLHDY